MDQNNVKNNFPVAYTFVSGKLKDLVTGNTLALMWQYPKMPRSEAECIVSSRLNVKFAKEFEILWENRRKGGDMTELYDAIVLSKKRIGEELQDLTGTRTLLSDENITDEYIEATYNPKQK